MGDGGVESGVTTCRDIGVMGEIPGCRIIDGMGLCNGKCDGMVNRKMIA
jgi:hypothetical protein